jgi:signal transduction histidine kinase
LLGSGRNIKMKVSKLLFFSILFYSSCSIAAIKEPVAVNGVMDLRGTAGNAFIIKLQGQWEFYWKKMLLPQDFKDSIIIKPDFYGQVPSYWTDYPADSVKTTGMGYATYRLIMILPAGYRNSLGFDMPVFDSSYDIYVNGKFMGGNGTPGKTESETKPGYVRNFFRFNPSSDSVEIIVNVSNFHHRRGGFWLPMKIGTFSEVQKGCASAWARDWATMSFLLGFSLLFFFFFIIYTKDSLMGFFSLATIGLALRPLFTSNFLIHNIMKISWIWIVRWEYLGLYLILTGWFWFAVILYPSRYFRTITWTITVIFSAASILTLFLPVRIFSYMTFIIYPLLILLIGYSLSRSIRGMIRKNRIDFLYFTAFALLSYAAIHDVRISLGKSAVTSGYILTYILALFVFIQAVLILYKWVKGYSEKEKLQKELEYMNRNLGILVSERTQEINARKEEIENKNIKIAFQNKQLSETIQLKNKIFSVIAHDLRSPVVNILYMLNLLKEEEYKEKYDSFADSSIQYAQQVISLLENMLVWGRGQEDKIKFSPERRDLADIVLTNMSIFKDTADKKEISVNFTQIGNSKAYFDKDLMDIIIRNLLSNAVKYTDRGGRISILLKDKSLTGEGIILKICDNGIGIPETKQKYLFTSTEIESTPGTENEKGTGFGLKLCYELVKINNGTITVESIEGEGTCFTITLPEQK